MGKLRSSIDETVKTAETLEKAANQLLEERAKLTQNFLMATDFCRGGGESIYMYLMEKYKKNGEKIEDHKNDTLKEVIDANIAGMVKELVAAQDRVVKNLAANEKNLALGKAVKGNVAKVRTKITTIEAMIAKKKKKWLQSKEYKAKLKGYEAAIKDLDDQLVTLDAMLPGKSYGKYVDPKVWKVSTSTTVEQIRQAGGTYLTADLKMLPKEDAENAKKFRGRGFAKSLKTMKEWASQADEMEKE